MGALSGKVAVVTGGSSGIGERIVEVFVEEGAKVVVAARRAEEGKALATRLGVEFIRADISVEADVKAMIDHAVKRFGRLDCLVNNAGIPAPMISIAEIEVAMIDSVLAINVRGVLLGIKHAAPVMVAQGAGSIINIASIVGHRGGLSSHVYTASKGAVLSLTRSAAAELGEKGVRVNSISPGAIVTGIFGKNAGVDGAKADKVAGVAKDMFATLQPIPKAGMPEDIARAAVYFASDGSSFVTGQDLLVDGGQSAVVRSWSSGVAGRAELYKRIKAAADAS